jgi:hypothetical protein
MEPEPTIYSYIDLVCYPLLNINQIFLLHAATRTQGSSVSFGSTIRKSGHKTGIKAHFVSTMSNYKNSKLFC